MFIIFFIVKWLVLREGLAKNRSFYPHFVDRGGGSANVDKREGGGGGVCFFLVIFGQDTRTKKN